MYFWHVFPILSKIQECLYVGGGIGEGSDEKTVENGY